MNYKLIIFLIGNISGIIINQILYPTKKIQKDCDYCKTKLYKVENKLLKMFSDKKISKEDYERIIKK